MNTTHNNFICVAFALFTSTASLLSLSIEHCGKWPRGLEEEEGEGRNDDRGCVYFSLLALAHFFLCKVSLSSLVFVFSCAFAFFLTLPNPQPPYSLCLVLISNQSAFVYLSVERREREFIILCNQLQQWKKREAQCVQGGGSKYHTLLPCHDFVVGVSIGDER